MKLFFILGNQLFPTKYIDRFKKDHLFFMAEDKGLCTYEKHHKQKILLFLSSMRSYADQLKKNKFKLDHVKIEDKEFNDDYLKKLKKIITQKKIKEKEMRKGLYANIHAKRKRGEKMRKKGAKGAPTAAQFRRAAQTVKKK